jgi:hypothetical protein
MPEPSGCPGGLYALMAASWAMRAEDRPSFAQLKQAIGE